MNNIEYLEELINIKSFRLQKFEALVRNDFKIENKLYSFEAEVSDYYLKLKSGEEEINIPYPSLKFDEGTVIVPFGENTYHVGVDDKEVEGDHLSIYDLLNIFNLKDLIRSSSSMVMNISKVTFW